MFWRTLAINGAVAVAFAAAPPPTVAQTNIDQGKSPAEIFATDCAACHKSIRGLAAGKNSLTLSSFLREHYTSSRDQAAAMASYVLSNGGNAPAAPNTNSRSGRAAIEEPKTSGPKSAEPKSSEPKPSEPRSAEPKPAEPKPSARAARAVPKPGELAPANARPQRPPEEEGLPATAAHEQKLEPAAPAVLATPAPVPAAGEAPSAVPPAVPEAGATTSAVAPAEAQPTESEPVPRDNIPD